MTSSQKSTETRENLVGWATIDTSRLLSVLLRNECKKRHLNEEFLGLTIIELVSILVPSASLKEHSKDDTSSFWSLLDVFKGEIVPDNETVTELINGNCLLTGKVLHGSSQESLWEEES